MLVIRSIIGVLFCFPEKSMLVSLDGVDQGTPDLSLSEMLGTSLRQHNPKYRAPYTRQVTFGCAHLNGPA